MAIFDDFSKWSAPKLEKMKKPLFQVVVLKIHFHGSGFVFNRLVRNQIVSEFYQNESKIASNRKLCLSATQPILHPRIREGGSYFSIIIQLLAP